MERAYYFCIILFISLFLGTPNLFGINPPIEKYRCLFYDSYIKGEMDNWAEWIEELNVFYNGDFEGELVSLQAQYGLIGYYFGTKQKKEARKLVSLADEQLNKVMVQYPNDARLHSLKAAFNSFKLGLAVYKAPILGPRILKEIETAIKLNSNESMCWLENGNALYNRPAMFGGNKKEAIKSFQKSLQLYGIDSERCNYLKVLTEVFILKGFYETKQLDAYKLHRQNIESKYGKIDWIDEFLHVKLAE